MTYNIKSLTLQKKEEHKNPPRIEQEAFASFDSYFNILNASQALYNILGSDSISVVNRSIFTFPFLAADKSKYLTEQLSHKSINSFKLRTEFTNFSGELKYVEISLISHLTDQFSGGILILKDLTSFKSVQNYHTEKVNEALAEQKKELQELKKQLKSFLYITSHDLKEPLRTIGNFSQLLVRQCHGYIDEIGREYLNFIVDGVRGMNALIDDLMHYSELDTRPHENTDFHLPTLVFMLEQMKRKELIKINGEIHVGSLPDYITADKMKIRRLLDALILNSIKFRDPNRNLVISINSRETEDYWEISFSDNGIGIKEEFFGKIFEMFKKLHSKQFYEGTGVGLALCKKIVEQHHGNISVASTFGSGTTFTFSIMKPTK